MKKYAKRNIILGIIVIGLFYISSFFQLVPIILFDIDVENISGNGEVLLTLFSSIILILIFIYLYGKQLKEEFLIFKSNIKKNLLIGLKYWVIGYVAMIAFNYVIIYVLHVNQASNQVAVESIVSKAPLLMLLSGGFVSPFIEEIAFRKTTYNIFKNKWVAAIISGLIFGLVHVVGQTSTLLDWLYVLPYGALGFCFALAYHETDSIFTSYTFHIIHNVPQLLLLIF